MDTQVNGVKVWTQKLGKLPAAMVTFYQDKRPNVTALEGKFVCYLGYKESKKSATKREKMAVQVTKLDADGFSGVSGHTFLNELIQEAQESVVKRAADGEDCFAKAESADELVKDWNDTSRDSSGRKITKEAIAAWFHDECDEYITTRALMKNAQMKEDTLAKLLDDYAGMFCRFTKYDIVNAFAPNQFALVKQILANTTGESEMREWINERVAKIEELQTAQDDLVNAI